MINLPVPGANVLAPLDQFKVITRPTLLLEYLAAHGHDDAGPSPLGVDHIEVTYRGFAIYSGLLVVYRKAIEANMLAVRQFLGYPD